MSDDRINPFWEFCYETGIDPTGGEPDTGEVLKASFPNHQLQTSAAACGFDLKQHHNALADAEACAAIAMKTMSLADLR